MVGVIPGVECARRRRFHDSKRSYDSSSSSSSRRSFSLYTPRNVESLLSSSSSYSSSSSSSLLARGILNNDPYSYDNTNKLGEAAKEAKQRLDDKFNAYRKSRKSEYNQKPKQKTKTILNGFCLPSSLI